MSEIWRDAWTSAVAEGGREHGLIAGILLYVSDGAEEVQAQSFVTMEVSREVKDEALATIEIAARDARKKLASPSN